MRPGLHLPLFHISTTPWKKGIFWWRDGTRGRKRRRSYSRLRQKIPVKCAKTGDAFDRISLREALSAFGNQKTGNQVACLKLNLYSARLAYTGSPGWYIGVQQSRFSMSLHYLHHSFKIQRVHVCRFTLSSRDCEKQERLLSNARSRKRKDGSAQFLRCTYFDIAWEARRLACIVPLLYMQPYRRSSSCRILRTIVLWEATYFRL